MKIIIPTFRNSKKLERSLRFYDATKLSQKHEIFVLDATIGNESEYNKNVCDSLKIKYINYNITTNFQIEGYFERIMKFLDETELPSDELVCLIPDEDIVLPEYIDASYDFMKNNDSYSLFCGRYITLSRPIMKLHRISSFRDKIIDLDVSDESSLTRAGILRYALVAGCSPIYWGTRRVEHIRKTIKYQMLMKYGSSCECIDQSIMCALGNVRLDPLPMLIRDETDKKSEINSDDHHHHGKSYIPLEDLNRALNIFKDNPSETSFRENSDIIKIFFSPYHKFTKNSEKPIIFQIFNKNYSNFKSYFNSKAEKITIKIFNSIYRILILTSELIWSYIIVSRLKKIYGNTTISSALKYIKK